MKIFGIKHHGLGDSLAFSTIPQRFTEEKGLNCYFYEYDIQNFKNKEIYNLVWGMNPFIKGITNIYPDSGGNIGSTKSDEHTVVWHFERLHGLEPKNEIPKIYYEPKVLEELKEYTIIDVNSFHYYKKIFENRHEIKELVMSIAKGKCLFVGYDRTIGVEEINSTLFAQEYDSFKIHSLLHYCDVLNSCKQFIGANSGCNSLAAAIGGGADIIMTEENKGYTFPNNNYHYL